MSSTVSSIEIVNATTTATITSMPRSRSDALPVVESPLTTTPVITLISGSAPRSFHRSGTPAGCPAQSGGRCSTMSSTTGRRNSSDAKNWSTAA